MLNEVRKDIKGYEGLYQVTNMGKVISLPKKRKNSPNGYYVTKVKEVGWVQKNGNYKRRICVLKDGNGNRKFYKVHRLVAEAFIPNPNNHQVVNHKDFNPLNNRVDNLEWCTQKHNLKYSFSNHRHYKRFSRETELNICREYKNGATSCNLANEYQTYSNTITNILRRHGYKVRTSAESKSKYKINLSELLNDLRKGIEGKDLAKKYNCSRGLVYTRKHQFKKAGLL